MSPDRHSPTVRYWTTLLRTGLRATLLRVGAPTAIAVLVVLGAYQVAVSSALSADQRALVVFGSQDAKFGQVRVPLGDRMSSAELAGMTAAAQQGGAASPAAILKVLGLAIDEVPEQFTSSKKAVQYLQADRSVLETTYPGVYELRDGTWPARPGEVAISPELADQLAGATTIHLGAGAFALQVVGVVANRYVTDSWTMMAAPQTWESIPASRLERGDRTAEGLVEVSWTGTADPRAIGQALVVKRRVV